jgi:MOSC domain-containing protein YiiM
MGESVLPIGEVASVWERHPIEGVAEQPVHFVRRRTDLRKQVDAMGLEDSEEWHRAHYKQFMEGEPWDRAILIGCASQYTDLKNQFPQMKHYWEDPEATFGEQLILNDFDAELICLGDELQSDYGPLRLKVTCPRLCCFRVDHRYPAIPAITHSGQPGTVRHWASAHARAGFMCKVLRPGTVQAGDKLKVEKRHFPQYPLSRLAGMVYGTTPIRVDFKGTDDELKELCNMQEDLCHFEWFTPLKHFMETLMKKRPLRVHEDFGAPVSYDDGMQLVEGRWCRHGEHERAPDGTFVQAEVSIKFEGENLVGDTVDSNVIDGRHIVGTPFNSHGKFAVLVDMGGFPNFPIFGYMTQLGSGRFHMVFSNGRRWYKEPEI